MLEQTGHYKEERRAFAEYSELNDSVRTAKMINIEQLSAQFEVDRLKMEKLELSEKIEP